MSPSRSSKAQMRIALIVLACLSFLVDPNSARSEGECSLPDDDRCELWSSTWDSGRNDSRDGAYREDPADLAAHGRWLYIMGESQESAEDSDVFLVKTNALTGALVWDTRVSDRTPSLDAASSIAVSPSGSTLYLSGTRDYDTRGHGKIFLSAFSASGRELWSHAVHGGKAWGADAEVIADGDGAYVTGSAHQKGALRQVVTARYSADGTRIWKRIYGLPDAKESASDLATDGSRVFLTATRKITRRDHDLVTLAYDQDGEKLWEFVSQDDVPGYAYGAEVRYRNEHVFVFGTVQEFKASAGITTSGMYALDAATGNVLWSDETSVVDAGYASGPNLALSPDGTLAYAIGLPGPSPTEHFEEFLVRACDSGTGQILWTATYDPAIGDVISTDAVAREEGVIVGAVSITTAHRDMMTFSFSRETGSILWSARHNPSQDANAEVESSAIGLGPNHMVIHAGHVYDGVSESGQGYGRNDVVIAAYE